jgi:hypothetical protein
MLKKMSNSPIGFMVGVDERAKIGRTLEYSELTTLAGCVTRGVTLTWALI